MAFSDLQPTVGFLTIVQNLKTESPFICKDSTGADVDMSTWDAFSVRAFLSGGAGNGTPALAKNGSASSTNFVGSSGDLTLILPAADSNDIPLGTFQFNLYGRPTSGDDYQLVASGSMTVLPQS
jgi:hypothetical protein